MGYNITKFDSISIKSSNFYDQGGNSANEVPNYIVKA